MARAMKDSGIPWIGEIPDKWKLVRGKFLFRERIERGNKISLQLLTPSQKYGVVPQELYDELSGMKSVKLDASTDYNTLKSVYEGDFVISLRSFQGGFEYSKYDGVVSPAYHVFYRTSEIHNEYYRYMFKNSAFIEKMATLTKTFRDGKSIAYTDFADSIIPVPPIDEQQRIAAFIDTECARIDAVIEKTRASIEEYKKLKQAVITEAVTKGIRPGRKMKDSGIEWIGEIPEEWVYSRFKFVAQVKANLVEPDGYGDYPQVSPENIEKGSGQLLPCKTVAEVGVISGNHLFYQGQILYSKIRPKLNKITIAPFDGLCSADMYPIETTQNTQFMLYAMLSDVLLAQVAMITEDRVKMPKINQDELGNTWFAIPPSSEQEQIVLYLDDMCDRINCLITEKQRLLSELDSYKKSVIYKYVTGKKEVPHEEKIQKG